MLKKILFLIALLALSDSCPAQDGVWAAGPRADIAAGSQKPEAMLGSETAIDATCAPKDSLIVSLLTCDPFNAVHALYGHTAIRCRDLKDGSDWVFNYGTFNFATSFFALRFALGLTDYELGVLPFRYFHKEFAGHNCRVREQILNLTTREKERLLLALDANYLPENRVYRYNIFHNNCTTRARDIIEQTIDGRMVYPEASADDHGESFRSIVRRHTAVSPWNAFADDLCLGALADCATTQRERQFLPANLEADFENAYIYDTNGHRRLLVASSKEIITPQPISDNGGTWFTPMFAALLLLAAALGIVWKEWKQKKTYRLWDIALMAAEVIVGLLLTVLFFSLHPTTSTNCQLLLFSPLPLLFVRNVWRREKTIYWWLQGALIILFFICGIFLQSYHPAMYILALTILTRAAINILCSRAA